MKLCCYFFGVSLQSWDTLSQPWASFSVACCGKGHYSFLTWSPHTIFSQHQDIHKGRNHWNRNQQNSVSATWWSISTLGLSEPGTWRWPLSAKLKVGLWADTENEFCTPTETRFPQLWSIQIFPYSKRLIWKSLFQRYTFQNLPICKSETCFAHGTACFVELLFGCIWDCTLFIIQNMVSIRIAWQWQNWGWHLHIEMLGLYCSSQIRLCSGLTEGKAIIPQDKGFVWPQGKMISFFLKTIFYYVYVFTDLRVCACYSTCVEVRGREPHL